MNPQQVKTFIEKSRQQGVPDGEIVTYLKQKGVDLTPKADMAYHGADNLTTTIPTNPNIPGSGGKALNIPGISKFTGGDVIAKGLGQAIANTGVHIPGIVDGNPQADLAKANETAIKIQGQLLDAIKANKAQGKDTSRLQNALTELTQHIQDTGNSVGELGNQNNITPGKVIGDALQLGTTVVGAGSLAGAAKEAVPATGIVAGSKQGAIAGAKVGGIYGASSGVSGALKDNGGVVDAVKGGVKGAIGGALAGGAVGAVAGGVSGGIKAYTAKKSSQDFIDKMITPPTDKGKASLTAIKTGKVQEGTGILGQRDFSEALPNFDNMKTSIAQVPGVSAKNSNLQNLNAIHDAIGTTATDLKSQLESSGISFTPNQFNKYMKGVKTNIVENPSIVGDAETSANKILSKFNSLVKENGYTPSGLLEARKQLDQWASSGKGAGIFNPTTENGISIALKGIRQGGNNFLSNLVPDVAVKDMLAHQSNLYNAIDVLAPKAQKEGATYATRLIATFHNHPVKSVIGAGGALAGGALAVKKLTGF